MGFSRDLPLENPTSFIYNPYNMNILILGLGFKQDDTTYEMERLKDGFEKRGHNVSCALWSDVLFSFDGENSIKAGSVDIKEFEYIVCRYPLSTTTDAPTPEIMVSSFLVRMYKHFLLLVDYANKNGVKVLNEDMVGKMTSYDKMTQHYILNQNNIPTLPSFVYTGYGKKDFKDFGLDFPFVAKTLQGSRGVEVFLIEDDNDFKNVVEKYGPGNVLLQKYIQDREDYRVITIGDEVVGGVLCINEEGDFRTNMIAGGKREKIEVDENMKNLVLKTRKIFNAEFTGIDIIKSGDEYYVLEVNVFPMFMGFENATSIDVVEKLSEHIEKSRIRDKK